VIVSLPAVPLVLLLASVLACAPGSASANGGLSAKQAGRTRLTENATLHLANGEESTLHERGEAHGTFNAPLSATLDLSPGHVTGFFTIHPSGGTIRGKATARFVVQGSVGYYGGTLNITGGSGRYAHASGSNVAISGTISRQTFVLTVKASGWIRL
jgi:hypothetical protein